MDIMIIPSNLYCLSFLCNLNYTVLSSWFYKTLWLEKYHIHNELCLIYARHSGILMNNHDFFMQPDSPGLWFSIFRVVSPFVTSSFHNVCWLNSVSYYFFYKLESGRQFNRPWKKQDWLPEIGSTRENPWCLYILDINLINSDMFSFIWQVIQSKLCYHENCLKS